MSRATAGAGWLRHRRRGRRRDSSRRARASALPDDERVAPRARATARRARARARPRPRSTPTGFGRRRQREPHAELSRGARGRGARRTGARSIRAAMVRMRDELLRARDDARGQGVMATAPERDRGSVRRRGGPVVPGRVRGALSDRLRAPRRRLGGARGRVCAKTCSRIGAGAARARSRVRRRPTPRGVRAPRHRAPSASICRRAARSRARVRGGSSIVRADLRALPFATGAFDHATCFFTSFGYFETEDENLAGPARGRARPPPRRPLASRRAGSRRARARARREERVPARGAAHALRALDRPRPRAQEGDAS